METLKYKIIKSKLQYKEYCKKLEQLIDLKPKNKEGNEEIDLLNLLIEKWDNEHNTFSEADPVKLLNSLMEEHNIKPKDLSDILKMSKGYISDVLHYKKGFSKEVIRTLSDYFKVRQEAFNRPYKLKLLKSPSRDLKTKQRMRMQKV